MSVEMIDPDMSGEVIDLFGEEALKVRRKVLQQRLGETAANLVKATNDHNECINEIIELDMELRQRGVDTQALALELQQDVAKTSAVNNYGHYE